ncbi:hypothetical protein DH2020_000407 [Rehmannia glutinosa]|uniref:DRBM domain-containing protein n=1 Tax=Rehmannia glutinosa TaxID=99300 RepID=A0ABR0XWT8_REHGL
MEAGQIEFDCNFENAMGTAYTLANPATPPAMAERLIVLDLTPSQHHLQIRGRSRPTIRMHKRKIHLQLLARAEGILSDLFLIDPAIGKDILSYPDSHIYRCIAGVSNCYVFKSRLQEYCQKAGVTTPVYETIKEGPSHEPSFRSTVIVNNVRYDSLPGFFNRKAAEQSAAEVALVELANSVDMKFGISQPVQETGLCKNLLQEYAQKMNYAIPLYECHKDEKQGRTTMYSCVVEIGGIKYIGASASTKKEAEIKAARTAMLAIQSAPSASADQMANSIYTVVPQKKRVPDMGIGTQDATSASKPKKGRFKQQKRRRAVKRYNSGEGTICSEVKTDGGVGSDVIDTLTAHYNMAGVSEVHIGRTGLEVGDATDRPDIYIDGQRGGFGVTNIVSSQGTDCGPTVNTCSSGVYNANLEYTGVPFDGKYL